jgi:hypothetical protein
MFKGLTARRLYTSFGVKGLISHSCRDSRREWSIRRKVVGMGKRPWTTTVWSIITAVLIALGLNLPPFRWPIGWAVMRQRESNRLKFWRVTYSQENTVAEPINKLLNEGIRLRAQKDILTRFHTKYLRFPLSVIPPVLHIWSSVIRRTANGHISVSTSTRTWTHTTTRTSKGRKKKRKFVPPTSDGVELITPT